MDEEVRNYLRETLGTFEESYMAGVPYNSTDERRTVICDGSIHILQNLFLCRRRICVDAGYDIHDLVWSLEIAEGLLTDRKSVKITSAEAEVILKYLMTKNTSSSTRITTDSWFDEGTRVPEEVKEILIKNFLNEYRLKGSIDFY